MSAEGSVHPQSHLPEGECIVLPRGRASSSEEAPSIASRAAQRERDVLVALVTSTHASFPCAPLELVKEKFFAPVAVESKD